MTAQQLLEKAKLRRDENRRLHNASIKEEIKAIQRKMVEISFLSVPDIEQHKQLLMMLKKAKMKLI